MSIHRVRSLIHYLEYRYTELKNTEVIPKKAFFTGLKRGGSFPKFAEKMGYMQFGMFMDHYIRAIFVAQFDLPSELAGKKIYDIYLFCCQEYFGNEGIIAKKEFVQSRQYFLTIGEFIASSFPIEETKSIEIEPEWSFGPISGHPDLVIDDTIYDIKTSGQFNSMRVSTIFQLLSYYVLAQQLGKKNLTHIGVILPAQSTTFRVSLAGWKWEPFWNVLTESLKTKLRLQPSMGAMFIFRSTVYPRVGSHTLRKGSVSATLEKLPNNVPWQVFFAGRAQANFKITDIDVGKTLKLVEEKKYRFYVHAPYTLNLSRKYDDNWVVKCLTKHVDFCASMGGKGVVVHCGVKAKDIRYEDAYQNMLDAVIQVAKNATPESPLLVETSAGETGELVSDPAGLIGFYHSLPEETQKNVKICVDTCHVFSAGYMPLHFIHELTEAKVPIAMIHYNDSLGDKGCCQDRHMAIGRGFIGIDHLVGVASYAIQNNIDLVHE